MVGSTPHTATSLIVSQVRVQGSAGATGLVYVTDNPPVNAFRSKKYEVSKVGYTAARA